MSDSFRNILIMKPSALGDIVQALPALSALRRSFPDSEISWLIRPEFTPLIENHPHLTRVIHFDRKFLSKMLYNPAALAAFFRLCRQLRHNSFDAVFDFQGLFRTAFLARVSGCKKRFGLADAQEFSRLFYTHRIQKPPDSPHVVDYYMNLVRAAGAADLEVEFTLPRDAAAEKSVKRLLAANGITSQRYAVLVPGSAHADKCWPIDRFTELAGTLSSKHDLSVIAAGGPSEAPLVQSLLQSADVPITNLVGRTSLAGLIALLRDASLVVSNDTGPGHIAAALGRPIVMIFGRSNPARVAPYGRDNTIVAIDPKGRGPLPDSRNPIHNIRLITLDDVYQKVQMQINSW